MYVVSVGSEKLVRNHISKPLVKVFCQRREGQSSETVFEEGIRSKRLSLFHHYQVLLSSSKPIQRGRLVEIRWRSHVCSNFVSNDCCNSKQTPTL